MSKLKADTLESIDGLSSALVSDIVMGDSSVGTNGWTKLPNGLIIQWGSFSISTGSTVTFPTPFTTACFGVQLTAGDGLGTVYSLTTTTFTWHDAVDTITSAKPTFWFAIGV